MLKRVIVACAFGLMAANSAVAGPWEDGVAAYQRGEYATALKLWQPLAESGDPRAENNLGVLYEKGLGVSADPDRAAHWYRKAAAHGHVSAQENLTDLLATTQVGGDSQAPPATDGGSTFPTETDLAVLEDWRSIATWRDQVRVSRFPSWRVAAIKIAENDPAYADVRAVIEGPTVAVSLDVLGGQWRCRLIDIPLTKLRNKTTTINVADHFDCEIIGYSLRKSTGSVRLSGKIYNGENGFMFLGAREILDQFPIPFGSDPERDEIGLFRTFGPDHFAIEVPDSKNYATWEFVRSNRKPISRDPHRRQTTPQ
jgi:Domain of unknown function (DUF4893)/Sel1 repeat